MKIALPIIERKNLSSSLYGRISITKKKEKKKNRIIGKEMRKLAMQFL